MADQATSSAIDQAVDDVVRDIEQAQAARDHRAACVNRMTAMIQMAAMTAYTQQLGMLGAESLTLIMQAPAAAELMTAAVLAAGAEGQRLLALLGVDMSPTAKGG